MTLLAAGRVTGFVADLLRAVGLPDDAATRTAQVLVLTDVWGIGSHGLMRLPFYLDRLTNGGCNPHAALSPVTHTGPLVVFDGGDGLGHWQVWRAAELARDRCAAGGLAAVGVSSSSHCGALGVYTAPLLEAGMVGIVVSNGPAVMPPWGGHAPVLSTSPIAAGIPCRPTPAVVDLATSAVARGRIKAAAQRGEPIEAGWAFTADGEPTTDAGAAMAGMLAPLGGAKGFALAFLVEALTGALLGPALSVDVPDMFDPAAAAKPQGIGHLVIALDPARFGVRPDAAQERLDGLAAAVTAAGGRLPGAGRVLPRTLFDAADDTVLTVPSGPWSELSDWAARLRVDVPS